MKARIVVLLLVLLLASNCSDKKNPVAPGALSWHRRATPQGLRVEQIAFTQLGDILIGTWWHPQQANPPILGAGEYRIQRSSDAGEHWLTILETDWIPACISVDSENRILVGTFATVRVSDDAGASWHTVVDTLPVSFVHTACVAPNGDLYVGANGGSSRPGGFRSGDGGRTWEELSLPYQATAFSFLPGGAILAGVLIGPYPQPPFGLFRSMDQGRTWAQVLSTHLTREWWFAADGKGTVYAATNSYGGMEGGVYRSTDQGSSWTQVNRGLPTLSVNSIAVDASGRVFASIQDHGVFRSADRGESWQDISAGLTDLRVQCLGVDPSGTLYAGTGRSDLPTSEPDSASVFRLEE